MCAAVSWVKPHTAHAGETDFLYDRAYLERQKHDFTEKNGNLRIREIRTDRLSRDAADAVLREVGVREGDRLSSFDPYRCVDGINRTGLFSDIRLSYSNERGAAVIGLSMQEKSLFYDPSYLEQRKRDFISKNGNLKVREIRISGLRRTSEGTVLRRAGVREGDWLVDFNPYRCVDNINRMGLFTDIRLSYMNEGNAAVIDLTVDEKWSFIPIPMVNSNNSGTSVGFYLMDMNFFGRNKKLIAGGTWSATAYSGMLGYIDPSVNGSNFEGGTFLSYKREIRKIENEDESVLQKYKGDQTSVEAFFGYRITERLTFDLKPGVSMYILDSSYRETLNAPSTQKNVQFGAAVKYDGRRNGEYLSYGPFLTAVSRWHSGFSGAYESYGVSEAKASFSLPLFSEGRVSFDGCGFYSGAPDILKPAIGGRPGFFTVAPDVIVSDKYGSMTASIEYPLIAGRFGALTILSFWEQGGYRRIYGGYRGVYGPGIGTVFYLKRVAIPALGLNLAWSVPEKTYQMSFAFGMQM